MAENDQIHVELPRQTEYLVDGVAGGKIAVGGNAARLQPFDRFRQHLAVAPRIVDQARVAERAGDHGGIRGARRNHGQHGDPGADENGEFRTAAQRAATRLGPIVAEQNPFKHKVRLSASPARPHRGRAGLPDY